MRIGVLTTSFPRFEGDVAGHFVLGSCRALASRGHHVEVLVPQPHDLHATPHFAETAQLHVVQVPYLRPRDWQRTFYGAGVPDNLRVDPRAWLGLLPFTLALAGHTAVRAHAWDAVISHWALPCGLLAALRPARCRHLAVLHSADVHVLHRLPVSGAWAATLMRNADHLWFSSHALRDRFDACLEPSDVVALHHKSTCRPMGIDAPQATDDRETLRQRLGVSRFTALVLSRLVPIKGIEHAIRATDRAGVDLVIAGDGPEHGRLQQIATELGARVRFVGVISGVVKAEWLSAADVLLVPSLVLASGRTEGVPTAALEALSYGCPVIASDVGGIRDVIEHERTGWLVEAASVDALAAALCRARDDQQARARIAHAGRQRAESLVWPRVIQAWESALQHDR